MEREEDKSNELTEPSCENLVIAHFLAFREKTSSSIQINY